MPHDPHLAEAMRAALSGRPGVAEKKMFGGYCWMLNGNMICGVEVGRFMFRVGKDLEAEALARNGARPMDITGRPMRGFVWVVPTPPSRTDWIAGSISPGGSSARCQRSEPTSSSDQVTTKSAAVSCKCAVRLANWIAPPAALPLTSNHKAPLVVL